MYRGQTDGLPQSLQPRGSNSDDKQSFGSASTVIVDAPGNNYIRGQVVCRWANLRIAHEDSVDICTR